MSRWRHLYAVDHDPWAVECYRANMPGAPVELGEVDPERVAAAVSASWYGCDVLLGGPPCQPFSRAGRGDGENDPRDGFPVFDECVHELRPRHAIVENVAGVLDERHRAHYMRFLASLEALGYEVRYRKLDAADFGVPQHRWRVWAWAIRGDVYEQGARHLWPEPTHADPEHAAQSLRPIRPWVTSGEALGITGPAARLPGASGWAGQRILGEDVPAHTVTGEGTNPELVRVMGGGTNPRSADNPEARTERDITGEPSTTIATAGGNQIPALRRPQSPDFQRRDRPVDEPAFTIDSAGNSRTPVLVEPCCTITGGSERSHTNGRSVMQSRRHREELRRLTPDECARLQSVPDDWVWPDGMPKTAKYRVVGNGWACRMAAHMSDAVRTSDPGVETVVDLFCGGGLGAVGWSGRYWGGR